jgi:hypothetical protein
MRRLAALAAAAASIAALAAACSTFGGGEDATTPDDDAGAANDATSGIDTATSTPDAAEPPDDATADAGACDLVSPDGLFFETHFDKGNCEGWEITQGTLTAVKSPTRCGAGACKVCSTALGETILQRDLGYTHVSGTFEARFEVRGDTFTGYINAGIYPYNDAGGQVGFGQNPAFLVPGQWSPGQIILNPTGPASRIIVRLVAQVDAGGFCYLVDEIRLGHYP